MAAGYEPRSAGSRWPRNHKAFGRPCNHEGHEIVAPPEQPRGDGYHDSSARIWWIGRDNLQCFKNGRFREFPLPEALSFHSGQQSTRLTEDGSGVVWVAASNAGLFSMKNGVWKHFEAPLTVPGIPQAAYTDGLGRAWFGYHGGEIIVIDDGNIQLISPKGSLKNVHAINGRAGRIWVGGDFGLAFFDGSGCRQVTIADASTLGRVLGIEEPRDGGLWLCHSRGVTHIAESEIQHFLNDPSYRIQYELFDSLDGLPGTSWAGAVQGTDGRLWFAAGDGLAWLDPAHLSRNTLPPPVVIRSLTADGKPYPYWTHAELPPLTRSLQIQFTALSLSIPERVRFRYKLEGLDKDWQDGGGRREVSYGNLDPRKYRFHVIACNNDSVWNETALLQSFHGVSFGLQAVSDLLPECSAEAKGKLDSTIDQGAAAITEGRDAVQDLRSSTVVTNNLAVDISALGQELAANQTNHVRAAFRIEVQGAPRDLHPILRDEMYRIAGEALRNAFKHAQARQIEVGIRYEEQQLRLLVRDDGKGIDSKILEGGGPAGHFGLKGLRERAELAGGRLDVWSKLGAGTEVDLCIPASVAYVAPPAARRSWFSRKAAAIK
jgi:hypothetical protein